MSARIARTSVPINVNRAFPPEQFSEAVKAVWGSGVVDDMQIWDQLVWVFPKAVWNAETTPMATVLPDPDAFPDAFTYAAFAAAVAPGLGTSISTDAIRRGPAEMMQTMLTLSNMTGGRSIFKIGAGEIKQTKPYGWKRKEGLGRLEDLLQIFNKFWESDGPIDFEGNYWKLDQAWLGGSMHHKPQVWALGGGPKLLDLATTHADGFAAINPYVYGTPADWGARVDSMKQDLQRKERDPEAYGFGMFGVTLIHEDENVIDRALDHPLLRFMAAVFGRITQSDWDKEGITPVYPRDWHYALKLLPVLMTKEEFEDVVSRTTREMAEKSAIYGTPKQVAEGLQQYVDAGCTWMSVCDILPFALEPDDAEHSLPRSVEVCRHLKQGG